MSVCGRSRSTWVGKYEWLEYTVDVPAGIYDVEVRVASAANGGTLHIEFSGQGKYPEVQPVMIDETGPVAVPGTGGWQSWTTARARGVTLGEGVQTMHLVIDGGAFNVNRITIVEAPFARVDGPRPLVGIAPSASRRTAPPAAGRRGIRSRGRP